MTYTKNEDDLTKKIISISMDDQRSNRKKEDKTTIPKNLDDLTKRLRLLNSKNEDYLTQKMKTT